MNKALRITLIVAASLLSIGLLLGFIGFCILGFDLSGLGGQQYVKRTYPVSESFENISIDTETANIQLAVSDDGTCKVVCYERERLYWSVRVENETLVVGIEDERHWYEHIGIFVGTYDLTVYLPKSVYTRLDIESDTGDVDVPNTFFFDDAARISTDTGDVRFQSPVVRELYIETDTGDIEIASTSIAQLAEIHTDTGDLCMTNVLCHDAQLESSTGDITLCNSVVSDRLSVRSSTGDVAFDRADAASIVVSTSTGDVTGTLLSEKVFVTKTSTGKINVPSTLSGGRCEITTSTGDIFIQLS